jgi:hypothetical protein
MHPSLRPLLLATGALLASALPASAQFEPLLTEAPITIQAVLTTSTTTTNQAQTERRTVPTTSRLLPAQIIQDVTGSTETGWSLVAVRYVPPDLAHVNGSFNLYAVHTDQRPPVAIPTEKFAVVALGSVAKYRERHIGQYVLSSAGTVTNHLSFNYRPSFTVAGTPLSTTSSLGDGFATVTYTTRDSLGNQEVFFYLINSARATLRGGLQLSDDQDALISLTLNIGTPRLVLASRYPEVNSVPPGALPGENSDL